MQTTFLFSFVQSLHASYQASIWVLGDYLNLPKKKSVFIGLQIVWWPKWVVEKKKQKNMGRVHVSLDNMYLCTYSGIKGLKIGYEL
jgi:hypothetical protein